jgi:hypothetical protein
MNEYKKIVIQPFLENFIKEIDSIFKFLKYHTFNLKGENKKILAYLLLEFFDDIYNKVGIWKSYEIYNKKCKIHFKTKSSSHSYNINIIEKNIILFLYNIYPEIKKGLIINPSHDDLIYMASKIYKLYKSKKYFCKNRCLSDYFQNKNDNGYDIKRKLIWLGTESYFFKLIFYNYIKEKNKNNL